MDASTLRSPLSKLNPQKPICVPAGASMKSVIETLKKNRIGCLCIVDKEKLIGIVSERDVLTKVVGPDLDPSTTKVDEIMTSDPEYLLEDDEIAFAMNRMHVGGFRHIPITDLQSNPLGIISVRDILGYMLKNLENAN